MVKCQLFSQANHNNAICFLLQTSCIHISWDQSNKTFTTVYITILLMKPLFSIKHNGYTVLLITLSKIFIKLIPGHKHQLKQILRS